MVVPSTQPELDAAMRHLVAWLRWHMKATGIETQTEMGERLGVSKATITHWFKGRVTQAGKKVLPGMEALLSISKELKVSLDVLLGRDPPSHP